MKVAIISQSPSLTTGFGRSSKIIAEGLHKNQIEVVCLGLDQFGENFERQKYPYKIWAIGGCDLHQSAIQFIEVEKPDFVVINFDIVNAGRWNEIINATNFEGRIIVYVVFDGHPFNFTSIDFLRKVALVITPTNSSLFYLKSLGIKATYAPHGVDSKIFRQITETQKRQLRKKIKMGNTQVIGCFGKNTERKQQPRVIEAVSDLVHKHKMTNILLYLHCSPIDGNGWNLIEVAKYYNIEKNVIFDNSNYSEQSQVMDCTSSKIKSIKNIYDLSLNQRIGICDLCVNIPFNGGFEIFNLEVQATGVPLITVDDESNISEVVGNGAYLIKSNNKGIWRTGAVQNFVLPATLSEAMMELLNAQTLRNDLITNGLKNVKNYTWDSLINVIINFLNF